MKLTDIDKFRKAIDKVWSSDKYKELREDMDRYLAYYRGEYWKKDSRHSEGDSDIFVNFIFSITMTTTPLLTDNRPTWFVRARRDFAQRYFQMYNDALEYLWDVLECDIELAKVVHVALLMKIGIWKVFWDKSEKGEIAVENIDPRTFVIAPGYEDLWKAPWCGTYGSRPLTWVWDNFPEDAGKLTASLSKEPDAFGYDEKSWSDEDAIGKECNIYEMWLKDDTVEDAIDADGKPIYDEDKKPEKKSKYPYGRYVIFTDQKDEDGELIVLYDKDYKYKHSKPPFVAFYDYWNPFEFHGLSEPDQIETMVLEFNIQIKRLANYCRRFTGLNIFKDINDGVPTETFKENIIKGDDNVWEKNTGTDPPTPIMWPNINRTLLEFISALPKLIEDVSGVTEISKGMVSKKERQTAGEIATLIETSYTRVRQKVRNLEWGVKRACYLFVCLMQQFYREPRHFSFKRGNEMQYGAVTNNPRFLKDIAQQNIQNQPPPDTEMDERNQQQMEGDWEKFFEYFGEDPVYADFDIEIQTNSTLPMDKQTLANLFLRLAQMGKIDLLSLYEQLKLPNAEEMAERTRQENQGDAPPQGVENVTAQ